MCCNKCLQQVFCTAVRVDDLALEVLEDPRLLFKVPRNSMSAYQLIQKTQAAMLIRSPGGHLDAVDDVVLTALPWVDLTSGPTIVHYDKGKATTSGHEQTEGWVGGGGGRAW